MPSTVHVRRAALAACLATLLALAACGGGGGGDVAEVPGPGDVPDTPSLPPAPPTFTGLPDFAAASLVLGQPGFVSDEGNQGGTVRGATLNGPSGIAVSAEGMVFVADSANRRLLVFRQFPRDMGQAADFVLGQEGPDRDDYVADDGLKEPVSVSVGAGKVAVADAAGNRVLIYDALPADGTARPAFVVGQERMSADSFACNNATLSRPTAVQIAPDGKLIVADTGHSRVLIWKSVPTADGVAADVVLGQPDFEHCDRNRGSTTPSRGSMNEPEAVWTDGTRVAVADTLNERVLLWDAISMDFPIGQLPHRVLGQPGFDSATLFAPAADSFRKPRGVTFNGTYLAVSDNINNRVLLWDSWPTQITQPARNVLGQRDMSGDSQDDGGPLPTAEGLDGPLGLAFHGDKLVVVDSDNNRVLIYQSK